MEDADAIVVEIKGHMADIRAAYLRALRLQDDLGYAEDLLTSIELAERWLIAFQDRWNATRRDL